MKPALDLFPSSLIDPAIPLTPAERRQVHRGAWRRWMSKPRHQALYGLCLVLAMSAFIFLPDAIDAIFGYHKWYFTVAALIIYIGLLFLVFAVLRRYRFAPCVYAELRSREINVCSRCGYWLKGLADDVTRCPECGAERRPADR